MTYAEREADDIANLAFAGGKTNRQISDKPPSRNHPALIEKSGLLAFQPRCIPTGAALLEIGAYKSSLAERRRLVAEHLNEFLGVARP